MADERTVRQVDVLVVGAGPAGLSVAAELARRGAGSVEVLEREAHAGGVPRHSAHTGYGVRDLHRLLTGPAYARALAEAAGAAGAVVRTATTATGWAAGADDSTVPAPSTSPGPAASSGSPRVPSSWPPAPGNARARRGWSPVRGPRGC